MDTVIELFDSEGCLLHKAICYTDMVKDAGMEVGSIVDIDGWRFEVKALEIEAEHERFGTVNVAHLHLVAN